MRVKARKFHDEVWQRNPNMREPLRKQKRTMKERAQLIAEKVMTPEFRKKYHLGGPLPVGMGLFAYVYPSSIKGMMVKLTFSRTEAKTAERIRDIAPDFISTIHEVIYDAMVDPSTGKDGHLIYMEQLEPPTRKVQRALEDLLNPAYLSNQGTPRPKELIQHVIEQVDKSPKDSVLRATAKQLVRIFKGLYATKSWHADLHSDNIMQTVDGKLKLIDVGGMKELNVPNLRKAAIDLLIKYARKLPLDMLLRAVSGEIAVTHISDGKIASPTETGDVEIIAYKPDFYAMYDAKSKREVSGILHEGVMGYAYLSHTKYGWEVYALSSKQKGLGAAVLALCMAFAQRTKTPWLLTSTDIQPEALSMLKNFAGYDNIVTQPIPGREGSDKVHQLRYRSQDPVVEPASCHKLHQKIVQILEDRFESEPERLNSFMVDLGRNMFKSVFVRQTPAPEDQARAAGFSINPLARLAKIRNGLRTADLSFLSQNTWDDRKTISVEPREGYELRTERYRTGTRRNYPSIRLYV
jgi:hypothetical protein